MKIRLIFFIVAYILLISSSFAQESFWKSINGPYGGVIQTMLVRANGELLAGGEGIHLYKSVDNGLHWLPISTGSGTNVLLEAADGSLFINAYNQMLRSTDDGQSWSVSWDASAGPINCIARNRRGDLFVGSGMTDWIATCMYRSVDTGRTWQIIRFVDLFDNSEIDHIAISADSGHILASGNAQGISRSRDNGDTWEDLTNELSLTFVTALVASPYDRGEWLAGSWDGRLFRSTTDGETWTVLDSTSTTQPVTTIMFSDSNATEVSFGTAGDGIFRSTNGGKSWAASSNGLDYKIVLNLCKGNNDDLFAGTRGGAVYRSTDGGLSWHQRSDGIQEAGIEQFAIDSSGAIIAVSGSNSGVFRSTDLGENWESMNNGLDAINQYGNFQYLELYSIAIGPDDHLFAGSRDAIYRSSDGGNSWHVTQVGHGYGLFCSIAITDRGTILAGHDHAGVFRSTDDGVTWEGSSNGIMDSSITSMIVVDSALFAGFIYKSVDDGLHWRETLQNAPSGWLTSFAVSPITSHLFASNGDHGGVYESTDRGNSWKPTNAGLTDTCISSLAVNSLGYVFAGTFVCQGGSGIFRSTDDGLSWQQTDTAWNRVSIWSLIAHPSGYVFGSGSRGVFRSIQSTTGVVRRVCQSVPTAYHLSQNYPNPFNPSTIISYQIPRAEFVSLKIYNVLGQEVATLVHEEKQPGEYNVRWDGGGVPSGVYFYTMQSETYRETRKLLLLR